MTCHFSWNLVFPWHPYSTHTRFRTFELTFHLQGNQGQSPIIKVFQNYARYNEKEVITMPYLVTMKHM